MRTPGSCQVPGKKLCGQLSRTVLDDIQVISCVVCSFDLLLECYLIRKLVNLMADCVLSFTFA